MEDELIVVEKLNPVELFQNDGGMESVLTDIETKALAVVTSVETEKGRKEIASLANRVARSKTLIDNIGKLMVADWKAKAKKVDAGRKRARDFLDTLKKTVRAPLTEWEAIEAKRKAEEEEREQAKVRVRVEELQSYGAIVSLFDIAAFTDAEYEERLSEAKRAGDRLAAEEAARKAEAERLEKIRVSQEGEAARLKAIQDEQNRILAEERAKIEAERSALEAEKKAEQERRDREEFERQAKVNAEQEAKAEAQEAKDRAEAEKKEKVRQEALRPDKEQLQDFASMLYSITGPELKDEMAIEIASDALSIIHEVAAMIGKRLRDI